MKYLVKRLDLKEANCSAMRISQSLTEAVVVYSKNDRILRILRTDALTPGGPSVAEENAECPHPAPIHLVAASDFTEASALGLVASASRDGTIMIWEQPRCKYLNQMKPRDGMITSLHIGTSYSHDRSAHLAVGYNDGVVVVCNPLDGSTIFQSSGHTGWVSAVFVVKCAIPMARSWVMASAGMDNYAISWDMKTKNVHRRMKHDMRVYSVTVAARDINPLIVTGCVDGAIYVWDEDNGSMLYSMKRHVDSVLSLCFWENIELLLVSASADATIRVWDLLSGECVLTLRGHNNYVSAVSVGRFPTPKLVSYSLDKTFRFWNLAQIVDDYFRSYFLCIPYNKGERNRRPAYDAEMAAPPGKRHQTLLEDAMAASDFEYLIKHSDTAMKPSSPVIPVSRGKASRKGSVLGPSSNAAAASNPSPETADVDHRASEKEKLAILKPRNDRETEDVMKARRLEEKNRRKRYKKFLKRRFAQTEEQIASNIPENFRHLVEPISNRNAEVPYVTVAKQQEPMNGPEAIKENDVIVGKSKNNISLGAVVPLGVIESTHGDMMDSKSNFSAALSTSAGPSSYESINGGSIPSATSASSYELIPENTVNGFVSESLSAQEKENDKVDEIVPSSAVLEHRNSNSNISKLHSAHLTHSSHSRPSSNTSSRVSFHNKSGHLSLGDAEHKVKMEVVSRQKTFALAAAEAESAKRESKTTSLKRLQERLKARGSSTEVSGLNEPNNDSSPSHRLDMTRAIINESNIQDQRRRKSIMKAKDKAAAKLAERLKNFSLRAKPLGVRDPEELDTRPSHLAGVPNDEDTYSSTESDDQYGDDADIKVQLRHSSGSVPDEDGNFALDVERSVDSNKSRSISPERQSNSSRSVSESDSADSGGDSESDRYSKKSQSMSSRSNSGKSSSNSDGNSSSDSGSGSSSDSGSGSSSDSDSNSSSDSGSGSSSDSGSGSSSDSGSGSSSDSGSGSSSNSGSGSSSDSDSNSSSDSGSGSSSDSGSGSSSDSGSGSSSDSDGESSSNSESDTEDGSGSDGDRGESESSSASGSDSDSDA
jgi:clumping factor A